jgi:hypothetical protein
MDTELKTSMRNSSEVHFSFSLMSSFLLFVSILVITSVKSDHVQEL